MKTTIGNEKRLNVRMPSSEYARLKLLAARSGLSISEYIRKLVRDQGSKS
jgi:predicted DNA binding CopG/RHH family protein